MQQRNDDENIKLEENSIAKKRYQLYCSSYCSHLHVSAYFRLVVVVSVIASCQRLPAYRATCILFANEILVFFVRGSS